MDHLNKSPYYTKTSVEIWENKTADPMVIATAMTYGCAVFTLESGKQSRDINYPSSREPKVLNICDDLGVEILNLDSFLSLTDLAKFY